MGRIWTWNNKEGNSDEGTRMKGPRVKISKGNIKEGQWAIVQDRRLGNCHH